MPIYSLWAENLVVKPALFNLKAHLLGHIHAQYGTIKQNGTIRKNGAVLYADYSNLNLPNLIEI